MASRVHFCEAEGLGGHRLWGSPGCSHRTVSKWSVGWAGCGCKPISTSRERAGRACSETGMPAQEGRGTCGRGLDPGCVLLCAGSRGLVLPLAGSREHCCPASRFQGTAGQWPRSTQATRVSALSTPRHFSTVPQSPCSLLFCGRDWRWGTGGLGSTMVTLPVPRSGAFRASVPPVALSISLLPGP